MKQKWKSLCEHYTDDQGMIDKTFLFLEKKYNSAFRFYHNFNHIGTMIKISELNRQFITDFDALQFAIWFHDVIYKTWRGDNEEKSALVAGIKLRQLFIPDSIAAESLKMILKTRHTTSILTDITDDEKILIDIDLSVFSADMAVYREYIKNIRREFFYIPAGVFKKHRIKLLTDFLNRKQIYLSEIFTESYEQKARSNIKYELTQLQ